MRRIHLTPVAVAAYYDELEKIARVSTPVTGWAQRAIGSLGDTLSGWSRKLVGTAPTTTTLAPGGARRGVAARLFGLGTKAAPPPDPKFVAANLAGGRDIAGYAAKRQPLVGEAAPVRMVGESHQGGMSPSRAEQRARIQGRATFFTPEEAAQSRARAMKMLQAAKQRRLSGKPTGGLLGEKVQQMPDEELRATLHGKAKPDEVSVAELNAFGGRGLVDPDYERLTAGSAPTTIMPLQALRQHHLLQGTGKAPATAAEAMEAELRRIEGAQRARAAIQ